MVNNAGYSLSGDAEAATEEESHLEMETLFFGTARVTIRAVEVMRQAEGQRGGGLIFNISSERIPLRLPLGLTCWKMAKMRSEAFLEELEAVKMLSAMGQG